MAIIKNLDVTLGARTAKFDQGMRGASKVLGRFRVGVEGITPSLTAFGGKLAAVATAALGVHSAISSLTDSFTRLDAIAKTSDRLGIATEALIGLRHAAERTANIGARQFDTALQRMTRRVATAAKGTGEAAKSLKALRLNAKELTQLSPDRQFRKIADAMQRVEQQGERVRLAFTLFDTEGVGLVNTLRLGSRGLDDFARRAQRLGIVFSRMDLARIEAANDAFGDMRLVLRGMVDLVAVNLAPTIEVISRQIIGMGTSGASAGLVIAEAMTAVNEILARMMDSIGTVAAGFRFMQKRVELVALAIVKVFNPLANMRMEFEQINKELAAAGALFQRGISGQIGDEFLKRIDDAKRRVEELRKNIGKPLNLPDIAGGGLAKTAAALERGTKEAFSAARAGGAGQLREVERNTEQAAELLEESNNNLKQLIRLIEANRGVPAF